MKSIGPCPSLPQEETGRQFNGAHPVSAEVQTEAQSLICVVDHNHAIQKAVARLFQAGPSRIEFYTSADLFLDRNAYDGPCCLVLDLQAPGLGGIELQQLLSREKRTEQIIFVSGIGDVSICAEAFKGGAVDFLAKPLKEAQLFRAVEDALARSRKLLRLRRERQASQTLLSQLTPREREVLSFVIAGRLNKMIAAELGTTEKTVKKHRGHLMSKLKVGSVAELVHFSLRCGLQPARPYGTKVP